MSYYDDMGMDFEFDNQFRELGSCIEFSEMNETDFDYIDDYMYEEVEDDYAQ